MKPIISIEDIPILVRPCSPDRDLMRTCLDQAEHINLKTAIGNTIYAQIRSETAECDTILMDGGSYTDSCGNLQIIGGLKKGLAYYAYGLIVRNGSTRQTRFGLVEKEEEHSERATLKDRLRESDEAIEIGNVYINECLEYIKDSDKYEDITDAKDEVFSENVSIKIIGK